MFAAFRITPKLLAKSRLASKRGGAQVHQFGNNIGSLVGVGFHAPCVKLYRFDICIPSKCQFFSPRIFGS